MSSVRGNPAGGGVAVSPEDVLEIRTADGAVSRVALVGPRVVIGRSASAQIHLDCDKVSREHAQLFHDPFSRWWIRDLGSYNGTLVNGVAIGERVLMPGDTVSVGRYTLRLCPASRAADIADTETTRPLPVTEESSASLSALADLETPRVAASQLSMLIEFGRRLLELPAARGRLQALAHLMVGKEFHARWAAVLRLRPESDDPRPHPLCEPECHSEWHGWSPHVSKGLLQAVWDRDQPVLASNVPTMPADVNLSLSPDVMQLSAVACPLGRDAQGLDVLYVVLPPEFGTSEWLALVSLAVEECRQAQFAWAAREQAQLHAAIERELEQAQLIQMRLIPDRPSVPGLEVAIGFEPCRWVGGDYVDIVPMADGRTLLAVADVCGKGLQAAMVAAGLHTMVRAVLGARLGLEELMCGLNKHLGAYLPEASFVTMIALALDPKTGDLQCANAGHPMPLVFDAQGEARWLDVGASLPLGAIGTPIIPGSARLEPGELLVLFTDGLTDLHAEDGERLGVARLRDLVRSVYTEKADRPVVDIGRHLTAALEKRRGHRFPEDDRTFLLARRQ